MPGSKGHQQKGRRGTSGGGPGGESWRDKKKKKNAFDLQTRRMRQQLRTYAVQKHIRENVKKGGGIILRKIVGRGRRRGLLTGTP